MRSLRGLPAPRDDRVWDIVTGVLANTLAMTVVEMDHVVFRMTG